jgi:methylisocitrate lyase
MRTTTLLRKKMKSGKTVVAIGAYDALSSIMVEKAGFDAIYLGSYATEASLLGKPDLALMSKNERLQVARNVVKAVNIPVIVDAEEGFGTALHVMDTVGDFETMGVAGIHLDDEAIPAKCPFIPNIPYNRLITIDEMCGKIEAAVKARTDPDFLLIARSDVIGTVPRKQYYRDNMIEEVIKRSNAYAQAGADAIFVMALTEQELEYFAQEIKVPLVGVFAFAEPYPISAFQKAGCQMTIGSCVCLYAAIKGMRDVLQKMHQTGDWNAIVDLIVNDDEFNEILETKQYSSYYKNFRIP